MRIKNRIVSVIWKLAIFAVATAGVLLQIGIVGDGPFDPLVLNYFTVISNMLVAVYYLVDAVWLLNNPAKARQGREWNRGLKHVALLGVIVTGLIANSLIAGQFAGLTGTAALSMTMLHVVTPIMAVLDWLLFERKGRMKAGEPFIWLAFPLLYLLYVLVVVEAFGIDLNAMDAASRFPYPFIDLDVLGIPQLAGNAIGLAFGFLVVGYAVFAIDRILGKLAKDAKKRAQAPIGASGAAATEAPAPTDAADQDAGTDAVAVADNDVDAVADADNDVDAVAAQENDETDAPEPSSA